MSDQVLEEMRDAMTRMDEAADELVAAFRRGEVPERG